MNIEYPSDAQRAYEITKECLKLLYVPGGLAMNVNAAVHMSNAWQELEEAQLSLKREIELKKYQEATSPPDEQPSLNENPATR